MPGHTGGGGLTLQHRLAADIFGVGRRRIWLDPSETERIGSATSRLAIKKAIRDGMIIKKPMKSHSRYRKQKFDAAKRKGRHTGFGKRKGTRNARLPTKVIWMRRTRVLRRMLKRYRDAKKIDKHMYHDLYAQVKGARYKTKRVLMETIHRMKAEAARGKVIADQATAAKAKAEKKVTKKSAAKAVTA